MSVKEATLRPGTAGEATGGSNRGLGYHNQVTLVPFSKPWKVPFRVSVITISPQQERTSPIVPGSNFTGVNQSKSRDCLCPISNASPVPPAKIGRAHV